MASKMAVWTLRDAWLQSPIINHCTAHQDPKYLQVLLYETSLQSCLIAVTSLQEEIYCAHALVDFVVLRAIA